MFENPYSNLLLITTVAALIAVAIVCVKLAKLNLELANTQARIPVRAQELLAEWQQRELTAIRAVERESALVNALSELAQWKAENELAIRLDAVRRSESVTLGKITEHLVPYMPNFPFNAKDVRFVGSPIDLLVFDGLAEGNLSRIVFIEVKTGPSASLSKREKQVRSAVLEGSVEWLEMRIPRMQLSDRIASDQRSTQAGLEAELQRAQQKLTQESAQFARALREMHLENPIVGKLVFDGLLEYRSDYKEAEKIRQRAISAWKSGDCDSAFSLLSDLFQSDGDTVSFVNNQLIP